MLSTLLTSKERIEVQSSKLFGHDRAQTFELFLNSNSEKLNFDLTLFMFPACWAFNALCAPNCGPPCVSVSASTLLPTPGPCAPCMLWLWYCMPGLPRPAGPRVPFITWPAWPMTPWLCPLFNMAWLKPMPVLPLPAAPPFWAWGDWWLVAPCPSGLLPSTAPNWLPTMPPCWGPPPKMEELPGRRSSDSCLCLAAASGTMELRPGPPPGPPLDDIPIPKSPLGMSSSGRSFSRSNRDTRSEEDRKGNKLN